MFINKVFYFIAQIPSLFEIYFYMHPSYPKQFSTVKADFQSCTFLQQRSHTTPKKSCSSATSCIFILFSFFYLKKEHSKTKKTTPKTPTKKHSKKPQNKTKTKNARKKSLHKITESQVMYSSQGQVSVTSF